MTRPLAAETDVRLELRALSVITKAFAKLGPAAHHRALRWAWDRFIDEPGRQVDAMAAGLRCVSLPGWCRRRAS